MIDALLCAVKDWRSTVAGMAILLTVATKVHGLGDLADTQTLSQIAGGLGLIFSCFPTLKNSCRTCSATKESKPGE